MPPLWSRTYGLNDVAVDCLHDGASIMPCAWRDIENNLSMKRPRTAGLLQSGHCPYDNTWNKNFDSRRSSAIENFTFEHSSLNPGYFWMVIIIYIYINSPDCLIEIWKRVYLNSTEELSQSKTNPSKNNQRGNTMEKENFFLTRGKEDTNHSRS